MSQFFGVLAIVNSAVMNIQVHMSLSILVSSVCMPSSGIAVLYGSSISSFLRNFHTVLPKFRGKLKKVDETTRPFRYELNQIPYDYTVEVRNGFAI